jgi:hypothetical protein
MIEVKVEINTELSTLRSYLLFSKNYSRHKAKVNFFDLKNLNGAWRGEGG